ncbi:hypothetical protein [Allorhizobium terrae]|nr:hypothetical protein [Allorhizobium terrae]
MAKPESFHGRRISNLLIAIIETIEKNLGPDDENAQFSLIKRNWKR